MTQAIKPKWPVKFTASEIKTLKEQLLKDGYRMTRADFAKASGKLVSGMSVHKTERMARLFHHNHLVIALRNGKSIPPSVLKDYPKSQYLRLYALMK